MSTHTLKEISSDVAVLLGEPDAMECQPEESPVPCIEDRVRILAPGILQTLILTSPNGLLKGNRQMNLTAVIESDGRVVLPLPDDFLRLTAVRMSDWKRTVTEVSDGEAVRLQSSRWRGVGGVAERPVAEIEYAATGERALVLHSSSQGAVLQFFRYEARPAWSSADTLEVNESLYADLIKGIAEYIRTSSPS